MDSSSSEDDEFQKRLQDVVQGSELGLKASQPASQRKRPVTSGRMRRRTTDHALEIDIHGLQQPDDACNELPCTGSKPSLRHKQDEDSDDGGDSVSSAGFKAHMSKKLSAFLDESIVEISTSPSTNVATKSTESEWTGLKLFSTSDGSRVKTIVEVQRELDAHLPQRRRRPSVSSGSEDDDEEIRRLASAAVCGEDIVERGDMKNTDPTMGKSSAKARQEGVVIDRQPVASIDYTALRPPVKEQEVQPKKGKKKKKKKKTDGPSDSSDDNVSVAKKDACDELTSIKVKTKKKGVELAEENPCEDIVAVKHKPKKKKHKECKQ